MQGRRGEKHIRQDPHFVEKLFFHKFVDRTHNLHELFQFYMTLLHVGKNSPLQLSLTTNKVDDDHVEYYCCEWRKNNNIKLVAAKTLPVMFLGREHKKPRSELFRSLSTTIPSHSKVNFEGSHLR